MKPLGRTANRIVDVAWGALVLLEIATKLAIIAPAGVAIVVIDVGAEVHRRLAAELERQRDKYFDREVEAARWAQEDAR